MFYKRYQNKVLDLVKIAKKAYYKNCFLENKRMFESSQ